MKKLCCLLVAVTFVSIGILPAHAQLEPFSQLMLTRMLTDTKYYMFDRVKTMCEEWPGCKAWALARHAQNPSFHIIDAEMEYYVTNSNHREYWNYNMYVETMENLQTQTYVFVATDDKFNAIPSKFRKFPGHPFTDMPSEHAKYEREVWRIPSVNSKIRKRWPEALDVIWDIAENAREQQRVVWDKNGNPRWERRLDVILKRWDGDIPMAIIARQQKLGGPFEYLSGRRTTSILKKAHYGPKFSLDK